MMISKSEHEHTGNVPIQADAKWELAQLIYWRTKAPEHALTTVFNGTLRSLKLKVDPSVKTKIWNILTKEKLKTLRETFFNTVCEKTLGSFTENEAHEMVQEHKSLGYIKKYNSRFIIAAYENDAAVIKCVYEKAGTMTKEILELAKKECKTN